MDREKILDKLTVEDYSEGPLEDTLYRKSDLWVFGKEIKKREVYIKISIGQVQEGCCVFHFILQNIK